MTNPTGPITPIIQPSRKLSKELDKRANNVLENMLAEESLVTLKQDMLLAEKGKVPEYVIGPVYEKALNTYRRNPSKFKDILNEFEGELENYFPFGGVKTLTGTDFEILSFKYFK